MNWLSNQLGPRARKTTGRKIRERWSPSLERMEERTVLTVSTLQSMQCTFDLMMVVDGSGSIASSDFQLQKDFINQLLAEFMISPQFVNAGIIQFSTSAQEEIGLSDNPAAINAAVTSMDQIGDLTNITAGLDQANAELLANGRVNTPKVIVLMTDGVPNEGGDPIPLSDSIKASGTLIFAIGIGSGIDVDLLNNIASDPSSTFVSVVDDFSDLQGILDTVAMQLCDVTSLLDVTPTTATNPVFTSHTVTATIRDTSGAVRAGVPVTFQITAGPNAGATGVTNPANGLTDANGQITFTYTSNGQAGTDTIVTTATLPAGEPALMPVTVTKEWIGVGPAVFPQVTDIARFGFHHAPTTLVLTFDTALNEARAEDLANYALLEAGRDRVFGTADDQTIGIVSAIYDPSALTVTLAPDRRLPLHGTRYQLTVNGQPPTGLTSAAGDPLAGIPNQPTSDYVVEFDRNILAIPTTPLTPAQQRRLARQAQLQQRRQLLQQRRALRATSQAAPKAARVPAGPRLLAGTRG